MDFLENIGQSYKNIFNIYQKYYSKYSSCFINIFSLNLVIFNKIIFIYKI